MKLNLAVFSSLLNKVNRKPYFQYFYLSRKLMYVIFNLITCQQQAGLFCHQYTT